MTRIKIFSIFLLFTMATLSQTKTVFRNGKIYTVNPKAPIVEVVIVLENRILFAGSEKDAAKFIEKDDKIIDLNGKLMLPGFIDNHTHFISGGMYLNGINLRGAKSAEEFISIIKSYVKDKEGRWIQGGNWDHEAWDIKKFPSKEMIDDFTKNTPVLIDRLDGHTALANSFALKLANIDKTTPNPDGGIIEKDPVTNEPTGILKDKAISLVLKAIPDPTEKEYEEALITALNEAKINGVTSVQDITYKNDLKVFQKFESDNQLSCRIYTRFPIADYKFLTDLGIRAGFGSDKIKLGSLKAFADGSLGSSTAWFWDCYAQDTNTFGLPMEIVSNGKLREWALDADKNGLQLSVHAIGDRANSFMLDLFEEIEKNNPKWDRRFRIEHAQHVRFKDIPRFKKIGVIASAQALHLLDDGEWAEGRIGKERIKYTYPFKTFLEEGVHLCFGSDWAVAPLKPIMGIYAAVTRRTRDDKNPNGWVPEEKISVEEAIKAYTINSAYAAFEENEKGSIEAGKLADLIVLSKDILTIDPIKIKDAKVIMTMFDGKIIFLNKVEFSLKK
jgi:predicted amidohydrolase YtcJ